MEAYISYKAVFCVKKIPIDIEIEAHEVEIYSPVNGGPKNLKSEK